jgi:uncharacterized phage protein gp47/JayE
MISIPTISQLYQDIINDLQSQFGSNIPIVGKNFLRASAMVQAARLKLYYLVLGNLQKNIFVDTADPEAAGGTLERFGRVKLNRNPFPAVAAQYQVVVTGSIGAVIKSSQTFKSNDDSTSPGMLFVLDNSHTLTGTTDTIVIRALTPGLDSKLSTNDNLTATSPIANVNSSVTVNSENIPPLAAETLEEYRAVTLQSFRLTPTGGSASDYRIWASQAQGVQQTYPYSVSGQPNQINLYVEAILADSSDGKGTPYQSTLDAVKAVVDADPETGLGRRPLQAIVNYLPVTIKQVDISVAGSSFTSDQQAAIISAMTEYLATVRPFVGGADVLANKNDIFSTNNIASVILNTIPGSVFGAITLNINSVPMASYQFTLGNIPWLNAITFP